MWDTFDTTTTGGGFMNNSNATDSPSRAKKEQVRRVQNVVPLVVSLITECQEENFTLFGMPVQIADVVGILRNFETQSTRATCTIEDHTGSIKAVLWLETDNDVVISLPPVKEGTYVRAFASIRHQDGAKMLMILKMFPIDDYNIVVNHMLQVIHVRLEAEKASRTPDAVALQDSASTSDQPFSFAEFKMDETVSNPHSLTPVQLKVLQILKRAPRNGQGVTKIDVLRQFRPNQAKEVSDVLLFLLNEGHAYTTLNSESYEATDTS